MQLESLMEDYVYAGGYGSGPTDNQWIIEKRDATSTGLRVNLVALEGRVIARVHVTSIRRVMIRYRG
jgi:hypothetical protein